MIDLRRERWGKKNKRQGRKKEGGKKEMRTRGSREGKEGREEGLREEEREGGRRKIFSSLLEGSILSCMGSR